jgi:hypothetical protein
MSQLNKRGAGFCQHGRRDFPGPGALIRFMHILRIQNDAPPLMKAMPRLIEKYTAP